MTGLSQDTMFDDLLQKENKRYALVKRQLRYVQRLMDGATKRE